MQTATMEEAQARLPELLDQLAAGEEVVITRDGRPVGRLLPPELPKGRPVYGRGKGKMKLNTENQDHLKDFAEYME
jgi:prevent-host-death family protein